MKRGIEVERCMDCFHEDGELQYDEDCAGDAVECYYADVFENM